MSAPEPTGDAAPEVVSLTVPAETDMVQVVRIAVRIVAGRAGCSDDARSRLQAAVGAAYFEVLDRSPAGATVHAALVAEKARMVVQLEASDVTGPPLDVAVLAGLGDGQEVADGGRTLRIWVAC